eukprot:6456897-Amphidinium_carterae.1
MKAHQSDKDAEEAFGRDGNTGARCVRLCAMFGSSIVGPKLRTRPEQWPRTCGDSYWLEECKLPRSQGESMSAFKKRKTSAKLEAGFDAVHRAGLCDWNWLGGAIIGWRKMVFE